MRRAPAAPQATITLYNGQHEQTTALLVEGLREADRHQGPVRSADEATLGQPDRAGGLELARRRVLTENTPPLEVLAREGPARPGRRRRRSRRCRAATTPPSGDWVGVSARAPVLVYNTSKLPGAAAAELDPRTGRTAAGRARSASRPSETDFQPLVSAIVEARRRARRRTLAEGAAGTTASIYPDNEAVVAQVNSGAEPRSARSTTTTGTGCATRSARSSATPRCTTSATATPATSSTSPAPRVLKSSAHQADAQEFLAFLVSKEGQEVIAAQRQLGVPAAARRRAARRRCRRSRACGPTRAHAGRARRRQRGARDGAEPGCSRTPR